MYCVKTIIFVNVFGCILMLYGCSSMPDHSNTLVFGTETKFALDVAASTTTQVPSITVGYKRTEAVWLPLVANSKTSGEFTPAECGNDTNKESCLFKSTENEDAYSVLASFGAEFGGEGNADVSSPGSETPMGNPAVKGSTKASGGIAQYFATGRAAQILADKGGASIVSIQSGNTKPEKTIEEVLIEKFGLAPEQAKEVKQKAEEHQKRNDVIVVLVMERLAPNDTLDKAKVTAVATELKKTYSKIGSIDKLLNAIDATEAKKAVIGIVKTAPLAGEKAPRDALLEQSIK